MPAAVVMVVCQRRWGYAGGSSEVEDDREGKGIRGDKR